MTVASSKQHVAREKMMPLAAADITAGFAGRPATNYLLLTTVSEVSDGQ
ncbi:hypothetical protein IRY61_02915 [Candidatus Saccharibacteria bacterium]|nr:hypothetical protein [Candidatus Saccharibacteria bacterium]